MNIVYIVMQDKYESYPVKVCSTAEKAQKYVDACRKKSPRSDLYFEIDAWVVDGNEQEYETL
jgi:hypothetical protein